jgi:hypothetical protein
MIDPICSDTVGIYNGVWASRKRIHNPLRAALPAPLPFPVSALLYTFTAPKVRPATMWRCTRPRDSKADSSVKVAVAATWP